MNAEKDKIIVDFHTQKDKYVYYIIALAVASIGFTINITLGYKISYQGIPLAIAILSWMISIYSGLRNRAASNRFTFLNIELLEVQSGESKIAGNNPSAIKHGVDIIKNHLDKVNEDTKSFGRLQLHSFYAGVISFVIWRVIDMS